MRRILTVVLSVAFLGLQYRLWIADGGVAHTQRLSGELESRRAENLRMRARNAAMDAEIGDLKSGVAAIESRARATLGMIRQGETFYFVVDKS
ncbi:MAG TPA: septum formation initiator family protein [Candidatus Binatia bacterium]|nr:septum formation initiator family protein [Candidatus Binatia bacterium]